jgi:hypothetical protein
VQCAPRGYGCLFPCRLDTGTKNWVCNKHSPCRWWGTGIAKELSLLLLRNAHIRMRHIIILSLILKERKGGHGEQRQKRIPVYIYKQRWKSIHKKFTRHFDANVNTWKENQDHQNNSNEMEDGMLKRHPSHKGIQCHKSASDGDARVKTRKHAQKQCSPKWAESSYSLPFYVVETCEDWFNPLKIFVFKLHFQRSMNHCCGFLEFIPSCYCYLENCIAQKGFCLSLYSN